MADTYPRIGGCARRLIDLRMHDAHTAVGWLEDDFHHFGVTIVHGAGVVRDVRTAAPRHPYSTCPGAGIALRGLIGARPIERASDVGALVPMRLQCTHMFDLAGLLLAHIASGRAHRRYQATVTDRAIVAWEKHGRRLLGAGIATLWRDGAEVLRWTIDRQMITGPAEWSGQSLQDGFRERTEGMDVEAAEHATVLRRVIMVAGGRSMDPDIQPTAGSRGTSGACYSFQEERRHSALRMRGSTLNYEESGKAMLGHLNEVP